MKSFIKVLVGVFLVLSIPCVAKAEPVKYIVKPGDTLWGISVKYNTEIAQIRKYNPQLVNTDSIKVGDVLTIPTMDSLKALENEVVRLVNVQRSRNGLAPLVANANLSRIARLKSQDMINKRYFSHYSPTYGSPFEMMQAFGIKFYSAGENIAMGQTTASLVMNSWMNSTGHKANILNVNFKEIGVGVARDSSGRLYWTQMFIRR